MEKEYQVFSLQSPLREQWIRMMNTAYSQSHRHYHTLTHVQSMLKQLQMIDNDFSSEQIQILRLAIWFHDVVYDIPSEWGYSECFSALTFQDYSRDARLDTDVCLAVQYLILCTLKHAIVPTFPTELEYTRRAAIQDLFQVHKTVPRPLEGTSLVAVFLDLDLSILGASEDDYDSYTKQIREEYSCYSVKEYRNGRAEVMKGFLNRERLYFTDYFYKKYEVRARQNIEREIRSLENGQIAYLGS